MGPGRACSEGLPAGPFPPGLVQCFWSLRPRGERELTTVGTLALVVVRKQSHLRQAPGLGPNK